MAPKVVDIFLTSSLGAIFEDFAHDDLVFTFSTLDSEGPNRLVDGPALCFVDWVLPDMSGLEFCRRLRANPAGKDAHITMILDHDNLEDRRRALAAGADNYMIGPIDRNKLLDHAMALQATQQQRHTTRLLKIGDLTIDSASFMVTWQGRRVSMRPNQFRLLRFFAERPNALLSRQDVIRGLGKDGDVTDERTVDVWIKRLRRNLRDAGVGNLLRTVHGRGYVLDVL